MNWNYISGFFDADGSITVVVPNKGKQKTIQVSFHNNELCILKSIQVFIYEQLAIKGSISVKKAKKDNHSDAYDLKYSYKAATKITDYLISKHPKKVHRIKVYKKIQSVTPRNGKYTPEILEKRNLLITEFFKH